MRPTRPTRLEELPNVGPPIAANLRQIDVREPSDLIGRDLWALFDRRTASAALTPASAAPESPQPTDLGRPCEDSAVQV